MTPAQTLVREQARAKREGLEKVMEQQLRALGIPFEREHRFAPSRKWRFDFAFESLPMVPDAKVALEVEGGSWVAGRHSTGVGMAADCEKYAQATILGWRVLRATTNQVRDGTALSWIERMIYEGAYKRTAKERVELTT